MKSSSIFLWLLIGLMLGAAAFGVTSGRARAVHSNLVNVFVPGAAALPKGVRAASEIAKSAPASGGEGNVTIIAKTVPGKKTLPGKTTVQGNKVRPGTTGLQSGGHPAPASGERQARVSPARSVPALRQTRTELVAFRNSAFPHGARLMRANSPVLNSADGGQPARAAWERGSHSDPRVLLHIPSSFDLKKPGVLLLFFHGHGATLERDVWRRQQVPAQISASGVNAVLAAPQFTVDAADSSPGNLGDAGGLERFLRETDQRLAALYGDPQAAAAFSRLPVVIVAYSGGYFPAAKALERGGAGDRVRGVVLLDGLYGNLDSFSRWIGKNRSGFFVSSYTSSTSRHNAALKETLASRKIPFSTSVEPHLKSGSVWFLSTGSDVRHRDFVTRAWTKNPVQDLLVRAKGFLPQPAGQPGRLSMAEEAE